MKSKGQVKNNEATQKILHSGNSFCCDGLYVIFGQFCKTFAPLFLTWPLKPSHFYSEVGLKGVRTPSLLAEVLSLVVMCIKRDLCYEHFSLATRSSWRKSANVIELCQDIEISRNIWAIQGFHIPGFNLITFSCVRPWQISPEWQFVCLYLMNLEMQYLSLLVHLTVHRQNREHLFVVCSWFDECRMRKLDVHLAGHFQQMSQNLRHFFPCMKKNPILYMTGLNFIFEETNLLLLEVQLK